MEEKQVMDYLDNVFFFICLQNGFDQNIFFNQKTVKWVALLKIQLVYSGDHVLNFQELLKVIGKPFLKNDNTLILDKIYTKQRSLKLNKSLITFQSHIIQFQFLYGSSC